MDKIEQSILSSLHPESLKLICERQPFPQTQDKRWSIDEIIFTDYDLFICLGGQARFTVDGQSWTLSKGHAFLSPCKKPVSAHLIGKRNFEAIAQHFELKLFGEEDFFSLVNYRPLINFTNWDNLVPVIDQLTSIAHNETKRLQRHALFNLILIEYLTESCISFKDDNAPSTHIVLEILSEIDRHFSDNQIIEKVMARSPYSIDYISRLFKKKMGRPPHQYLIYRRLQKSKDLLMQNRTVKEAAYGSGFRDELYFSRLFRKHEGCSPSEYRNRKE